MVVVVMLWVVLVLFAAVAGCVSDVDVSLLVLSLIAKKKKKKSFQALF